MFRKPDKFLQDIINDWQTCKFTKSVYDNAVNEVLDSLSAKGNASIKNDTVGVAPTVSQDSKLENEAVLMAIERKGLRKQDSECNCPTEDMPDTGNQAFPAAPNHQFIVDNRHDLYSRSREFDDSSRNDENHDSNFENNFMRTAVSAAIEQKGLGICRV